LIIMKGLELTLSRLSLAVAAVLLCILPLGAIHAAEDKDGVTGALAARGKYLVTIAACHDCHTPMKIGANGPEPDMDRQLSGHPESRGIPAALAGATGPWDTNISGMTAWAGDWGISFTANLTPDPDTGLGKWSFRNFKDTIRSGRHMGRGRPVLPPMPWPMYRSMTDEDLAAVFAYLQSIPAIRNKVPEPLPPQAVRKADAR
jgi:mono/diheme cytochrome c family protein